MDTRSSSAAGPSSSSSPNQPTSPIAPSKRMSSRNALATTTDQDGIGEPPTTPPNTRRSTKSRAASKGKEPVYRPESAQGQASRQDSNDEVPRHSHGLSWSSTTRDSVVDNLLLSLGNLSNQNLGSSGIEDARNLEFDRQKYLLPTMSQFPQFQHTKPVTRPRTHTYSSSMSSGYDGYGNLRAESPGSKHSGFTAKAQESESGSTLGAPSIMDGRIQVPQWFESKFGTEIYEHARNSRHTKDSSIDMDSADYGYSSVIDTTRLGWGGRRSFSMDQMYDTTSTAATQPSMLDRGRPRYDTLDEGAPEPGIPAGPRNKLNPEATGPVYVNRVPSRQSIRKMNTQSDLRAASKQTQGQPIPQYIHDQASDFVRLNSMRSTPSGQDSAPAPGPGMRSVRKDAPSPQRERPGFFKRVFGSGNSRVASSLSDRSDPQETIGYPDKASAPIRARSTASTATIQQPRESTASTGYPPPPQNLNKKPSSFFRRRKKSGSGMAPPPLPLNIGGANANGMTVEPSPSASSLRKVMDPYLAREAGAADSKRGHVSNLPSSVSELDVFQPGYGVAPDASFADTMPRIGEGTEDSPKMKIKIKKRNDENMASTMLQPPIDATFLHDSSRRPSSSTLSDRFTPPAVVDPSISPLFDPSLSDRRTFRSVSRASTGDRIIASESLSEPTTTLEKTVSKEERRNFSAENNINLNPQDEGWLVMHRRSGESATEAHRLVLKPTEAEETQNDEPEPTPSLSDSQNDSRAGSLAVSSLNKSPGVSSIYHSATSLPLPSVQLEGQDMVRSSIETTTPPVPAVMVDEGAEYRERARRIFDGDEEDVTKAEAAAWLGERNTLSMRTLNAYMQLFDFTGMSILAAVRILAGKLLLKGETQQFDRIITALSERWCECNTMHGFKAQDVVHTILYSLILLNTDLHLADIGEKMSKSAYVKNTLPTIRRVVADAAPNAFEDNTVKLSPIGTRAPIPWNSSDLPGPRSASLYPETRIERTSFEPSSNKRLSGRPGVIRTESDGWTPDSANAGASIALIAQTWSGSMRGWEAEVEAVLKSFYNSIRSDPLPMYGAPTDVCHPERNLAVSSQYASIKRSGSVVSKTPSDNVSYRSRAGLRTMTMGWQSRMNRSRPKLYPASTIASSRTSFDDNNSLWSPAQSSRSKTSFAKTLTSASMNSLHGYLSPSSADLKQSIGFASALSQAIIREESAFTADGESMSVPAGLLEDEALALEGAPWAKEGLVKHKHHLEASEKKVKSNWNDCFAVIGKGKLTLFAFGSSNKSQSTGRKALQRNQRGRAGSVTAQRVGGGDWMENAEQLDAFVLRQTIASVLPVPGYSKARPHVWALSLPSGAVHLFQVGTAEIANEFMTSANYWAARLSKEPLSGSVSNIEYGWSDQAINPALLQNRPESAFAGPPPSMNNPYVARHMHSSSGGSTMQRPSYQSSMRSSFDTGFGNNRMKLPGDRIQIADWQPPTQSMMASQLLEVDQLKQLTAYVQNVEAELAKHNELKHAIELAYSPRNNNYNKAMTNWQKKSEYLLREAVKFTKYTDSLTAAQTAKEDVYARKAEQDPPRVESPTESLRMRDERDITPRPRSLIRPDSPRPPVTAH